MEIVFSFTTTNQVIQAEQILLAAEMAPRVMSLPSQIKAGCGLCLRLDREEASGARGVLAAKTIVPEGMYQRGITAAGSVYEPWEDKNSQQPLSTLESPLELAFSECSSGGCGAKIAPNTLQEILSQLDLVGDPNLLVGFGRADDAAVYQVDEEKSLISTVDFFSPMVSNPRTFGRIAAANALSDVYAMGGKPLLALNLICFPQQADAAILKEILAGGLEKIREAGAVLGGGHSIYDKEAKYGLAVTGIVSNQKIIRNGPPQIGDRLILTKPLGIGIILAAERGGQASLEATSAAIASMEKLNRNAAEAMMGYEVSACTDVTGFGFIGHGLEMAGDQVSLIINWRNIPYLAAAWDYASEYLLTAAGQRNRLAAAQKTDVSELPFPLQELLFDPQTSGGLLLAVDKTQAESLLAKIRLQDPLAAMIGEVIPRQENAIIFKEEFYAGT